MFTDRPGSKHDDYYGTFKKIVRNSEYSKSDNIKKLSVTNSFKNVYIEFMKFQLVLKLWRHQIAKS